jgi:hypothetical protein
MKELRSILRIVTTAFTVAALVYAIRTKRPAGQLLSVPYDFRMPSLERLRRRLWNPEDDRVITPSFLGVGWSVNLYQALRQVQDYRPSDSQDPPKSTEA